MVSSVIPNNPQPLTAWKSRVFKTSSVSAIIRLADAADCFQCVQCTRWVRAKPSFQLFLLLLPWIFFYFSFYLDIIYFTLSKVALNNVKGSLFTRHYNRTVFRKQFYELWSILVMTLSTRPQVAHTSAPCSVQPEGKHDSRARPDRAFFSFLHCNFNVLGIPALKKCTLDSTKSFSKHT